MSQITHPELEGIGKYGMAGRTKQMRAQIVVVVLMKMWCAIYQRRKMNQSGCSILG